MRHLGRSMDEGGQWPNNWNSWAERRSVRTWATRRTKVTKIANLDDSAAAFVTATPLASPTWTLRCGKVVTVQRCIDWSSNRSKSWTKRPRRMRPSR